MAPAGSRGPGPKPRVVVPFEWLQKQPRTPGKCVETIDLMAGMHSKARVNHLHGAGGVIVANRGNCRGVRRMDQGGDTGGRQTTLRAGRALPPRTEKHTTRP